MHDDPLLVETQLDALGKHKKGTKKTMRTNTRNTTSKRLKHETLCTTMNWQRQKHTDINTRGRAD